MKPITAGTSGFRGRTFHDITPSHAVAIGALYAAQKARGGDDEFSMLVGHDQRFGATTLAECVVAGMQTAGAHVISLGQVPTAPFCAYMRAHHLAGGVLITGSHMPPDQIGIIPIEGDGTYATSDVTDLLEEAIPTFPENDFPTRFPPKDCVKPGRSHYDRYHESLLKASPRKMKVKPRVLIDPGNGTTGHIAARVLSSRTIYGLINYVPKPTPDRPSECKPSSCTAAIECVQRENFDLGVCFDGDGDRVLFIDHTGTPIPADVVGAIFALHTLKRGAVCVTPVNSSALIEWVAKKRNASVAYCRIGQPDTFRAVKEHRARFAYEQAYKYAWPEHFMWYDGVFAVLEMLAIMEYKKKTLHDLAAELPKYYQRSANIHLSPVCREQIVMRVFQLARDSFGSRGTVVDETDGLKFTFGEQGWLLLRPSGTEPLARVYTDGTDPAWCDDLLAQGKALFETVISAF